MIKLTSLNDLIVSLILKSIGNYSFSFEVYNPKYLGYILLEFNSNDYKFVMSGEGKDFLRVYEKSKVVEDGNICYTKNTFFIRNTIITNFDDIEKCIEAEANNLRNYYDFKKQHKKEGDTINKYVMEYYFTKKE